MILALGAILGPVAALLLILLLRRWSSALALLGASVAAGGALATLVRVGHGARFSATFLGLPGQPLRLTVVPLAAILSATVAVVTLLVLVNAVGYMRNDPDQVRFFAGMSFFAAAMQTLVLAGDWLLFLASWELIGFASYLLIGFWFERPGVGAAATRAFLTTRSADLGLYLGIFLLVTRTGATEIGPTLHVGGMSAVVASLLLLVSAMGKAAQVPFQGWLQEAMRGPTPVSALLHSATLVAAGVVLLTRAFPLLPASVLPIVGVVGGGTAIVAGVMALSQGDLKRLLAGSTSSQLGLMFLAVGAGSAAAAVVHLVAQAAMKSALFLGAGIFQEAYDSTNFTDLGGAGRRLLATYALFTLSGLALAGVPPLAGFWSKDAVVSAALSSASAWLLVPLVLAGTVLTGAYMARALRLLWTGTAKPVAVPGKAWMLTGLAALALLGATLGAAMSPIGSLLGSTIPEAANGIFLGLLMTLLGLVGGWMLPAPILLRSVSGAAERGFQIGGGWNALVVRPALAVARAIDQCDRAIHRRVFVVGEFALTVSRIVWWLDERGIDGVIASLVRRVQVLGVGVRGLQTGLVSRELVLAIGGTGAFVVFLLVAR